jgi:hypothetical protein
MLSEKEVISILKSNQMIPKVRRLGITVKLINGYSFIIRPDDSKPGYLCACLNHNESGVVTTWNEINYNSLVLAIKYVQALLNIKTQEIRTEEVKAPENQRKRELANGLWYTPVMLLLLSLLISTGYFAANSLISYCNRQRSEIPNFQSNK